MRGCYSTDETQAEMGTHTTMHVAYLHRCNPGAIRVYEDTESDLNESDNTH